MKVTKRALICGISGQDGAYLAKFLLGKGYSVVGTSRDAQMCTFENLVRLGIRDKIPLESMALTDFRSVLQTVKKVQPNEIYNLAGQTSVGLSFHQPVETLESISFGSLNLLEAVRFIGLPARIFNAGSSECFGETGETPASENTPFRPRSPYGVAKAASHWQSANYREAYDMFVCTGILFNHESPLRPSRFVTRKVITTACRIAAGHNERLKLGNVSIVRDWGWAPEYVESMWLMLQRDKPEDFVIATGESNTLEQFVATAFGLVDLDWNDHVEIDESLYRPTDLMVGRGCPDKAKQLLDWKPKHHMRDVVRLMVDAERVQVAKH